MDDLFENWSEIKENLLDGLDSRKREIVGPVLEQQKKYALQESALGAGAGAVSAHDVAGFRKILIPMIRRIIPGTMATELVGVQPMSAPVAQIFSMRYKYADAVDASANTHMGGPGHVISAGDELFGNTTTSLEPNVQRFYSGGLGVDQSPGAGGFGIGAPAISGGAPTGAAWGSSLDAAAVGALGAAGPLHGGSGSHLEGSGGRRVSLEVVSQVVEAGSRKLQASWTVEAMQDLNSQHGMDVESELTKAISAEIVSEIDAEVLNDLVALAGTFQTFDYSATGGTDFAPAYIGDRFANLGLSISYVANEIARKTRRAAGNWIVVSPMIISVLQNAAKSVFAPAVSGSFKGPNDTMLAGTLNSTIKVYTYLWNQTQPGPGSSDTILVGYKGGQGETDTGYFYCPYIPLMSSGVVVNPTTFQPVVSLMTRYGKTFFTDKRSSLGNSADYYGKVTVNNIEFV